MGQLRDIEVPHICLANLTSDPAAPSASGTIYYNTSTHKFRGKLGGSWVDVQD